MATVKPNTPNRQTRKVDGDHDRIRVNSDIDQLLDLSARRRPFTDLMRGRTVLTDQQTVGVTFAHADIKLSPKRLGVGLDDVSAIKT